MRPTGRARVLALAALLSLAGCSTGPEGPETEGPGASVRPGAPEAGSTLAGMRDAAVATAEDTAVALVSLDHRDPEAGYDRLLAAFTGPARQEWEGRRADYLAPIVSESLRSEDATVRASAVSTFDPATGDPATGDPAASAATVLVSATAMVSTRRAPDPEQRRYRLRISLNHEATLNHEAPTWKVSRVQFVS